MELYNAPHGIHAPITVKLFSQDFEFTYLLKAKRKGEVFNVETVCIQS